MNLPSLIAKVNSNIAHRCMESMPNWILYPLALIGLIYLLPTLVVLIGAGYETLYILVRGKEPPS